MRKDEAEARKENHARKVRRFSLITWLALLPVLSVVLYLVFSAEQHPAHHHPPVPFSCASEVKALAVTGSSMAPLCGETAAPEATPQGDG